MQSTSRRTGCSLKTGVGRPSIWSAVLLGLVLGACQPLAGSGGVTAPDVPIAFESIEGPPEAMRNQLAGYLAEEAASRQMRLVGTASPARYRVRGYLQTSTAGGGTLDYVWDVFDAGAQRAQRVAGSAAARGLADPAVSWEGVQDAELRTVARKSLDGITVFLVASEASGPAPDDGAAIAAASAPGE